MAYPQTQTLRTVEEEKQNAIFLLSKKRKPNNITNEV
jgi:hypothetical protein